MSELKRTQLYDVHVAAGATMVDFGGWEMPIKYPTDIVAEHLYTRSFCSLFDVSHMGRILVDGPQAVPFLQHVLSSNVMALDVNKAQYAILPTETGGAVDDAYLYRFEEDRYLLVVNAANTDKDLAHLQHHIQNFDARMTVITADWAAIAVQGPKSKELLMTLSGGESITEPMKNALNTLELEGHTVRIAKTGYTGEPIGYEVYVPSQDAVWLWNRLVELGARPAGLGARDTLRLEAGMPLYGHELGLSPDGTEIPIYAIPLARFAVSFSSQKGDFVGREPLQRQYDAFRKIMDRDFSDLEHLPRRVRPITLLGRGVMRAGMPVYRGDEAIGFVTSGTMSPTSPPRARAWRPRFWKRAPCAPSAWPISPAMCWMTISWRSTCAAAASPQSSPPTTCGATRLPTPVPFSTRLPRRRKLLPPVTACPRLWISSPRPRTTTAGARRSASTSSPPR